MAHINKLKKLGLNETEAKAYLALLKLGQANVSRLSEEISTPRTTLYYTLEGLKEEGLVFEKLKGKRQEYVARSPEYLEKKARKNVEEAKESKQDIEKLIPALKKLAQSSPSYSQVTNFEGKESVWEVFEIILRSNADTFWFGFGESFLESYNFDYFVENFSKKRRQFGRTKSYNIIPKFAGAEKVARRGETDFQEFRFMRGGKDFDAGICIFSDKIAIFSYDKKVSATLLSGDAITEIAKEMFMMIWKGLGDGQDEE